MSRADRQHPGPPIAAPVRITARMRWAARLLGGRPMPFRLPVGTVFHRYLSELSDWDTPPFFKSFLHLSVTPEALKIRCFAATGCLPQEIEPPARGRGRHPARLIENVGIAWQSVTYACGSRGRFRRWRRSCVPRAGHARSVTDLAAAVRELEAGGPRWVWADTREVYPALLARRRAAWRAATTWR